MNALTYSVTEVKIMKAIFIIAVVFACEVTSLECYQCSRSLENVPTCGSPERVRCYDLNEFCGKVENDWFFSLFYSHPGHYIVKDCLEKCTENGYFWFWGTWITCCQGDYCNV